MFICPKCWSKHKSGVHAIALTAKNVECEMCHYVTQCAQFNDPPKQKWPQFIKVYVHGSRDTMFEEGEKLGLTGDALSLFSHACGEICVKLEVQEDGNAKIIGIE